MLLIKRMNELRHAATVSVLTVYLYTRLYRLGIDEGYMQTETWIHEDLRQKQTILVPIHQRSHFTLVHIDTTTRVLYYLDSLDSTRYSSEAPRIMKQFIERYYRERGEMVNFKVRIREDIPKQLNSVDCGVFVCKYAESIALGKAFNFAQTDMPGFRWMMMHEILGGQLRNYTLLALETSNPAKKGAEKPKSKVKKESRKTEGRDKRKESSQKKPTDKGSAEVKERIEWPKGNSAEWKRLDTDLSHLL